MNHVRAVMSERTGLFRARFYPNVSDELWNDWQWQLRKGIRTLEALERIVLLTPNERSAIEAASRRGFLPLSLSPYYASLLDAVDSNHGLRRTVVPVVAEQTRSPHEVPDPLHEDDKMVVPGLVHRYPDRVLFLVTRVCASYCRFCTRSRMVGSTDEAYKIVPSHWEAALQYLRSHGEVRDVLLSGGDPLMLSDASLDYLLGSLAAIPHVEFVRIGTKIPVALPQRITPSLIEVFKRHRSPLWMSINVSSHEELTPEASEALSMLADAGIPLGSQTVLLKGVNDSVELMKKLNHGLLRLRVRPYYLYQLDPVVGTAHFHVPVARGLQIMQGLRGHTSGYAVPTYVIDTPGGKIPIGADFVERRDGHDIVLENFQGKTFRYRDPVLI